jgi:hypothetical protein
MARRFYGTDTEATHEFLGASPHRFEEDPALVSECAFDVRKANRTTGRRVCSSPSELRAMRQTFGMPDAAAAAAAAVTDDAHALVEHSKRATACATEACVIEHPRMAPALGGPAAAKATAERLFVPVGHFDNARALPDDHITSLLQQWRRTYSSYMPIPFQMVDFATHPPASALREFDFARELLEGDKRCFSVIFNSEKQTELGKIDPATGKPKGGKHWFCMFFDFRALTNADVAQLRVSARNAGNSKAPVPRFTRACTVEYFNSSARAVPYEEIHAFGKQLTDRLERTLPGLNVFFVTAARARQQYSKSECGMYSLVYIEMRLKSVPFTHFLVWRITDEQMHTARRHYYRGRNA